ncbi:MAG: ribbon-helix-helix domain-containing protein [Burkholderiales bacterium]|jgi:predicted transcriptional regulator|nr:ribbon-helix-helix domain-containing protein [Burkholderiales bacterium]
MSTTTIRLPEALKKRVAAAAERAGTTPHNFVVEAIAEKTDQVEQRGEFYDTAERRYAEVAATGKTIPWNEMRKYLEDRLAGKSPKRPVARKLGR